MEEQGKALRLHRIVRVSICLCLTYLGGCGPKLSTPEQIKQFERAGPQQISADAEPATHTAPYRVVFGDILQFQMPAVLRLISSEPTYTFEKVEPYLCRISDTGTINLPIVGEMYVAGKTVAEIEQLVVDAYYPKYVVNRPMVVCEVSKYQGENTRVFTVLGLVNNPSAFPYPPGIQYNLMEALAFAGGLDMIADPRYVKIFRQDASGHVVGATIDVNSKVLANAYNIIIKPGDLIYVDHTFETRARKFLSDVLRINVGADYNND